MTAQIERALQQEIAWRLKALPVVAVAIPNSIYIPTRDPAERDIAARIIRRMKTDGMFTVGAADMVLVGPKGGVFVELKRPRSRDLLTVRPKGRLSDDQKLFRDRCVAASVRYAVVHDWAELEPIVTELYSPADRAG